ncbi:MAG: hypothetical protein WBR28_20555 [Mycobacterium sp.]
MTKDATPRPLLGLLAGASEFGGGPEGGGCCGDPADSYGWPDDEPHDPVMACTPKISRQPHFRSGAARHVWRITALQL